MPKRVNELSALHVKRLAAPGRHAVGGVSGLSLNISDTGARSWILRVVIGSKRRHIGLGPYPEVSLADARHKAVDLRKKIAAGTDPVEERARERKDALVAERFSLTFGSAFDRYEAEKLRGELKNAKHAKQWRSTLTTYAFPFIESKAVSEVTVDDVQDVLRPIWNEKNETASRVRQRIEAVLDWATVTGHRDGENPARWKGNLQLLLPSPGKVQNVNGHPAVALHDVATWYKSLRDRSGTAARALELLTLTATRSGEIRGAKWEEFDLQAAFWSIPAKRMKAGREHRVPLSTAAMALVQGLPRFEGSSYVFPSPSGGQMSDMTVSAVMRRMQEAEIKAGRPGFLDPRSRRPAVPHGLRSTFRDWAAERTEYPRDLAEMALAHRIGNDVERAYRRGDMLDRRHRMMEDWAAFVGGG